MNGTSFFSRYLGCICVTFICVSFSTALRSALNRPQPTQFADPLSNVVIFPNHKPLSYMPYQASVTLSSEEDRLPTVTIQPTPRFSLELNKTTQPYHLIRNNVYVQGVWKDQLNETGWSFLRIEFNESSSNAEDAMKAYLAGVLEGYLTSRRIQEFYLNNKDLRNAVPNGLESHNILRAVMKNSVSYIQQLVQWNTHNPFHSFIKQKSSLPSVDRQLWFSLLQVWGIADGYAAARQQLDPHWPEIDILDMLLLSADGDYADLREAALREHKKHLQDARDADQNSDKPRHFSRCSALVRLSNSAANLFVGHTTWEPYTEMTRVIKYYNFPYRATPARILALTSYPGAITSTDDFILTSSGLAIVETSIDVRNRQIFNDNRHIHLDRAPDFMAPLVASRLSSWGKDWSEITRTSLSRFHGAASYEWMATDYRKFTPGTMPKPDSGLLFVIEKAPGIVRAKDVSDVLSARGFWSSANMAAFPEVQHIVGEEPTANYGREFTFSQGAPNINTLNSMQRMMQFSAVIKTGRNLSETAGFLIAPRFDLYDSHPTPEGATDSKVVDFDMAKHLEFLAISGPERQSDPPFVWGSSGFNSRRWPHRGLPDKWNFTWQHVTPWGLQHWQDPPEEPSSVEGVLWEQKLLRAAQREAASQLNSFRLS